MKVVETRLLEGPNYFLPMPSIKIEFKTPIRGLDTAATLESLRQLAHIVEAVHAALNQPKPVIVVEALETRGHFALVYSWERRAFAKQLAQVVVRSLDEAVSVEQAVAACGPLLTEPTPAEDRPEMVRDGDRQKLTIAVTGTNGKTTTTRLISHIFSQAGKRVGWSCSSGVYVCGEEVLSGDYSGLRGALRVLEDPDVEVAVIETARGGILIRGIASESVDVSVFTNISGDHLGLHGIRTVEGLARVKAVVSRMTRPEGFAILNADDPLVMESTRDISAKRFLVSQLPDSAIVQAHVEGGGLAMVNSSGLLLLFEDGKPTPIANVDDIPMTYRGIAGFMVENALCGAAAAYAAGATIDQIRDGLQTFVNSTVNNPGRLNVYNVNSVNVIIDYAHNEAGLVVLLDFAHSLAGEQGKVISVIGTAGDRTDESLRELGRIAARWSDHVIAKGTKRFLRGREPDELMSLYADGAEQVHGAPYTEAVSELVAVEMAVQMAAPGDAIAVMAQEEIGKIQKYLSSIGARAV